MNYNGNYKVNYSEEKKRKGFLTLQKVIETHKQKQEKFFIGRLSGNETRLIGLLLAQKDYKHMIDIVKNCSGINITNMQSLKHYFDAYLKSVHNCTLLGVWDKLMYKQCEDFYNHLETKMKKETVPAESMELFRYLDMSEYKIPQLIENKTILVITSHKTTTERQLKRLNHVFKDKTIFKNNKFIVVKPPVTLAGNHNNIDWYSHFMNFKKELLKYKNRFDIAFVSCGGYGMITCDFIFNELNASCIYNGGVQQLYFGIHGNRWNKNTIIQTHSKDNPNWTRVDKQETPKNYQKLEQGCYW